MSLVYAHTAVPGDGGVASYTLELAASPDDLKTVCALSGAAVDDFDGRATSRSHVLRWNGTPIGSIRACLGIVGEVETPASRVFGEALAAHLPSGTRYVESNRFVVSPQHQPAHAVAPALLFRAIAINMVLEAAPFVVAAVRVRQTPVYRRIMGFEPISGPQGYAGLTVPMVLMAADGAKKWADDVQRNPLLAPPPEELERYQRLAAELNPFMAS
jgi:hypothetical protein